MCFSTTNKLIVDEMKKNKINIRDERYLYSSEWYVGAEYPDKVYIYSFNSIESLNFNSISYKISLFCSATEIILLFLFIY